MRGHRGPRHAGSGRDQGRSCPERPRSTCFLVRNYNSPGSTPQAYTPTNSKACVCRPGPTGCRRCARRRWPDRSTRSAGERAGWSQVPFGKVRPGATRTSRTAGAVSVRSTSCSRPWLATRPCRLLGRQGTPRASGCRRLARKAPGRARANWTTAFSSLPTPCSAVRRARSAQQHRHKHLRPDVASVRPRPVVRVFMDRRGEALNCIVERRTLCNLNASPEEDRRASRFLPSGDEVGLRV